MIELIKYRTNEGVRSAFVKPGRKWLQVIALDATANGGLRIRKVPRLEERYMSSLTRKGRPYPVGRALASFRSFGKTHGITKGARAILVDAGKQKR